jgi:hypothetical protein
MDVMRRILPAIALAFLSPLVAEFLLGDIPLSSLYVLLIFVPMYGGATVVIREVARRVGLGWPGILTLALAYGVLEEGVMTMSLFNPDYAGVRLLDVGYVPALGIAVPWTLFVLGLHTVWSVSVPIALTEELTGERRTTPWLGNPGLTLWAVLALAGAAITTLFSYQKGHFIASAPQLAAVLIIVVALVVLAFRLPRRTAERPGRAPAPWVVLVVALVAGGLFELHRTIHGLPAWLQIVLLAGSEAGMLVLVLAWSARRGWDAGHRVALAGAALLTYAWRSFLTTPLMPSTPAMNLISHVVFSLGAVVLLFMAVRAAA